MSVTGYNTKTENMHHNSKNSGVIASIAESWSRCRDFGLLTSGTPTEIVLSNEKYLDALEENRDVRELVTPELELLYNQIAGTNFMVAYADSRGVVLDSLQDDDFKAGDGGKAVVPGSVWAENHRGTNALGLAIQTRKPSIVTGKDHFFKKLTDLSCFAVPIFNHENQLLGVLDATSNAKARNEHTLALVKLATKNIENRLFVEHFCGSLILLFHARHEYLPTSSAAMLAIDDYGFIEGANTNARAVLSGLDIHRTQHFGEVFDVQFFDIVDQLKTHEIISIRDRLGSVVFMRAQPPLSRTVIHIGAVGKPNYTRKSSSALDQQQPVNVNEPTRDSGEFVFEDEVLVKEITKSTNALAIQLPVIICGDVGTGRGTLASEINRRAFGPKGKLFTIDCKHLSAHDYEDQLFGVDGKASFFNENMRPDPIGMISKAIGGCVLIKNADELTLKQQSCLASVIKFEEEKIKSASRPSIEGWIFSSSLDWLEPDNMELCPNFINAIHGRKIIAPPLSQRSDFDKIVHAVLSGISDKHVLSPKAVRILRGSSWSGNFLQLKKVLKIAVAESESLVIRGEIEDVILTFFGEQTMVPCPSCKHSSVKSDTCVAIQRSWHETGGNVSLVARRLGISRNTVYKHVMNK